MAVSIRLQRGESGTTGALPGRLEAVQASDLQPLRRLTLNSHKRHAMRATWALCLT